MQGEDQEMVTSKRVCTTSISRTSLGKTATAIGADTVAPCCELLVALAEVPLLSLDFSGGITVSWPFLPVLAGLGGTFAGAM